MPRGRELKREPRDYREETETLAVACEGGLFTLVLVGEGEGPSRVELHISSDLFNDCLSLGCHWLRKVVLTLSDHMAAAGEDDFHDRLTLLAEQLSDDPVEDD